MADLGLQAMIDGRPDWIKRHAAATHIFFNRAPDQLRILWRYKKELLRAWYRALHELDWLKRAGWRAPTKGRRRNEYGGKSFGGGNGDGRS